MKGDDLKVEVVDDQRALRALNFSGQDEAATAAGLPARERVLRVLPVNGVGPREPHQQSGKIDSSATAVGMLNRNIKWWAYFQLPSFLAPHKRPSSVLRTEELLGT